MIVGEGALDAEVGCPLGQRGGVGIAQRRDVDAGDQAQAGHVHAAGDAAGADDADPHLGGT
jgi:hypothetical protein